ncbi:MAG: DUF5666 domain-containing protein, partial [Candidatus Moraniibacteriota bacterium]
MDKQEQAEASKLEGRTRKLKIAIIVFGAMLIALIIFASGVAVGFRKARFSYQWGQNYERNFMGHGPAGPGGMPVRSGEREGMRDFLRGPEGPDFRNAHGLAGAIISIADNNVIVRDRDGKENTVAVDDRTIIKRNADDLKISDLKVDDQVVVMGAPNDQGVVSAKLIRVFNSNDGAK